MERTPAGGNAPGGGGQVHSHVSNNPTDSGQGVAGKAREQAEGMADTARERAEELRDRAGEMASDARARAGRALHDAEDLLEERTGALSTIKNNAMPAMGIAFALGFALAGSSANKRGVSGFARRRVRTAVRTGLAAALTQELRGMAQGSDGLLATLFGQGSEGGARPSRAAGTGQRSSGGNTAGMRDEAGATSGMSGI